MPKTAAEPSRQKCPACNTYVIGLMQTHEVRCVRCQQLKWPMALERPARYTCTLCRSQDPTQQAKRAAITKAAWRAGHYAKRTSQKEKGD
jgi:hypothetical protein